MMTAIPTTKEQLVYYLLNNISLGTYDKRFLDNIQTLNLIVSKPLTSNQAELFDKIVHRYSRQLAKKSVNSHDMVNLKWDLAPIPSLPQYTQAFISIEDDKIIIKCPYKKEFITELKKITNYHFIWDAENRTWSVPLSEKTLRIAVETVHSHYEKMNCCDKIQDVLNILDTYSSAKVWDPTLVKTNGNLYIAAANEPLMNAISDIDLVMDPSILVRLTQYAIEFDDSLLLEFHKTLGGDDYATEVMKFIVQRDTTIEISDLKKLLDMLALMKCDAVVTSDWFSKIGDVDSFKQELEDKNISLIIYDKRLKSNETDLYSLSKYKLPVAINVGMWNKTLSLPMLNMVVKTVTLVNSAPIKIK